MKMLHVRVDDADALALRIAAALDSVSYQEFIRSTLHDKALPFHQYIDMEVARQFEHVRSQGKKDEVVS